MIDKRALYAISAGVYLFTMKDGERGIGRVVDAVSQVATEPKRISVSLMKDGHTSSVVAAAGVGARFSLTVLAADAPMALVATFGSQSSATVDKFAGYAVSHDEAGVPFVAEGAVSRMSAVVFDVLDMGSHLLVLADVVEAEVYTDAEAMTYAGYRKAKSAAKAAPAAAPASAPAAEAPAPAEAPAAKPRVGWRCMICGHVVECEELPADFTCPICGVGRELFERVEL